MNHVFNRDRFEDYDKDEITGLKVKSNKNEINQAWNDEREYGHKECYKEAKKIAERIKEAKIKLDGKADIKETFIISVLDENGLEKTFTFIL